MNNKIIIKTLKDSIKDIKKARAKARKDFPELFNK